VVCSGEIDMAAAAAFRALLDQAIKASADVVVDMADVSFLDSSGLRILAIARLHAVGSVAILNPAPYVSRVLEQSHLDRVIEVQPSRHTAEEGSVHHVVR
jgi:anti-sigma B factor antagonist